MIKNSVGTRFFSSRSCFCLWNRIRSYLVLGTARDTSTTIRRRLVSVPRSKQKKYFENNFTFCRRTRIGISADFLSICESCVMLPKHFGAFRADDFCSYARNPIRWLFNLAPAPIKQWSASNFFYLSLYTWQNLFKFGSFAFLWKWKDRQIPFEILNLHLTGSMRFLWSCFCFFVVKAIGLKTSLDSFASWPVCLNMIWVQGKLFKKRLLKPYGPTPSSQANDSSSRMNNSASWPNLWVLL